MGKEAEKKLVCKPVFAYRAIYSILLQGLEPEKTVLAMKEE